MFPLSAIPTFLLGLHTVHTLHASSGYHILGGFASHDVDGPRHRRSATSNVSAAQGILSKLPITFVCTPSAMTRATVGARFLHFVIKLPLRINMTVIEATPSMVFPPSARKREMRSGMMMMIRPGRVAACTSSPSPSILGISVCLCSLVVAPRAEAQRLMGMMMVMISPKRYVSYRRIPSPIVMGASVCTSVVTLHRLLPLLIPDLLLRDLPEISSGGR